MKFIYPAVFRRTENGGYRGYFPDLECCEAFGDTLDEAVENANAAATGSRWNWKRRSRSSPPCQTSAILLWKRTL